MKPQAKTALSLALAIVGGMAAGTRCDASVTVETPTQINPRPAAYTVKAYTEKSDPFIPTVQLPTEIRRGTTRGQNPPTAPEDRPTETHKVICKEVNQKILTEQQHSEMRKGALRGRRSNLCVLWNDA